MSWPPLVFDPAGPHAAQIAVLTWVLLAVSGAVFIAVCAALALAVGGGPAAKAWLGRNVTILLAGFAVPVVVLTGLLVYSLVLTKALSGEPEAAYMRIRITGEMWWWRVAYLGPDGEETHYDANELHIPVGQNVLLELQSADVIHSFWVPQLAGKEDLIPGRTNELEISASRPGVFAGQCAEFCGGPHALMGFTVVAHELADFETWKRHRETASSQVLDDTALRGAALFIASGCAACHAVRGTRAIGQAGPDLTFVGARQTLGAGILPNNLGTLAGWIAGSQTVKPGNRMPSYTMLPPGELLAIAAYLEQLR